MSQHTNTEGTGAGTTAALNSAWVDSPDYPHRIENHVKVYLHLEQDGPVPRWVVSPVTVDGYPLDGVEDGPYCDYEGHPQGARPDWDRQHQQAVDVSLPTAEELLPLLTTALEASDAEPSVQQRRTAASLIAEHAEWRSERADLSAGEASGDFPGSSDWHDSDDAGCDLADRAIALLAELTGHQSPTALPADSPGPIALQRSMLATDADRARSTFPGTEPPSARPAGPAR